MPLTIVNGDFKIVASQQLGDLGSGEGIPVVFHWRWYYHLPGLGLTALIGCLLFLSRSARARELWLSVSVVLAFLLWQLEGFSVLVAAVVLLWVVMSVWPARHRDVRPRQPVEIAGPKPQNGS